MSARLDRLTAWFDGHPFVLDMLLLAIVTVVAGALRLAWLGTVPFGLHPDEAQVGTDAHKILDGVNLGVYTHAALGQPSGHAYLATPFIWALGDSVFALRLPLALTGVAAIPLLYLLVRVSMGRIEAFFSAALLAISYWHLLYSRVAHWSISYGTVVLAVLLCVMLGMRQRRWQWFAAAGVLLGIGVYTYNIYPIAVVAVTAFIAIITWTTYRRTADASWWCRSIALMYGLALLVALPMIVYVSNPDAYYWDHIGNYSEVGVARSDEFDNASAWGKTKLIGEQARTFAQAYTYDGKFDAVDANGLRPVFDPLTLLLLAVGFVIAVMKRREPMVIAALCCALIIPLPAILQRGSIMRQPVAAAPFLMFIAALPLAALVRAGLQVEWQRRSIGTVAIPLAIAAAVLSLLAFITVRDYFWRWADDPLVRNIYPEEFTAASQYMADQSEETYFYLYSNQWPFRLETRQYLAPDAQGEDRSTEFSGVGGSIEGLDRSRPASLVLLPEYAGLLDSIERRYPGGTVREFRRHGNLMFFAYEIPSDNSRPAPTQGP